MLKRFLATHEFRLLIAAIALTVCLAIGSPRFLAPQNLLDLLANTAFVGMLASGLLVVLVAGSIDISFTATASIAQYVAILAAGHAHVGLLGTVSIACVIGTLLGMLNAWLVSVLRMSSIIVSIAMLNIYFGLLMLFSSGQQIFSMPDWFPDALSWVVGTAPNGDPYVLNAQIMGLVLCFAATWFLLNRTGTGRQIRALGGNPEAARRVGFRPLRLSLIAFGYLGFTAGLASLVQAQLAQSVTPNVLVGRELSVLAAVVLGGASLAGGQGTVLGTILGVAVLAIMENGFILIGVSSYWSQCFIGLVIIGGVSVIGLERKRKRKRNHARRVIAGPAMTPRTNTGGAE
jgi:simple sugar transport system permease protein